MSSDGRGITSITDGPVTPFGRDLAEFLGQLGPFVLIVPLLIVAREYARLMHSTVCAPRRGVARCTQCEGVDHAADARFCKACGARLSASGRVRG